MVALQMAVGSIFMCGITEGVLLSLDKAQWDKGVDPMVPKIATVLDSYKGGQVINMHLLMESLIRSRS